MGRLLPSHIAKLWEASFSHRDQVWGDLKMALGDALKQHPDAKSFLERHHNALSQELRKAAHQVFHTPARGKDGPKLRQYTGTDELEAALKQSEVALNRSLQAKPEMAEADIISANIVRMQLMDLYHQFTRAVMAEAEKLSAAIPQKATGGRAK